MTVYGKVHSLFTGKVKTIGLPGASDKLDQEWQTGAFKEKRNQAVFLSTSGFLGDECQDTKHHGGSEKAVFAYPLAHYDLWKVELDNEDIGPGGNGENLAVMHMDEDSVCIGDIYELGEAVIQVSQPRRPCWKPARRHRDLELAKKIEQTGRTGWYFRVLQEGKVRANDEFVLVERPSPEWSIGRMNEVLYHQKDNIGLLENLRDSVFTPSSWVETINRLLKGEEIDDTKRHYGPNI